MHFFIFHIRACVCGLFGLYSILWVGRSTCSTPTGKCFLTHSELPCLLQAADSETDADWLDDPD